MLKAIIKYTLRDYKRKEKSAMKFVKTGMFADIVQQVYPNFFNRSRQYAKKTGMLVGFSDKWEHEAVKA